MTAFRRLPNERSMWLSVFTAILMVGLMTSPASAAPGFKSTLISCPDMILCGFLYNGIPEPLTKGEAKTKTGSLGTSVRVKVVGAAPLAVYEVHMLTSTSFPPAGVTVGFLFTDVNGNGIALIQLGPDTYLSGVQLWRDSDAFPGAEPRIVTGFVAP